MTEEATYYFNNYHILEDYDKYNTDAYQEQLIDEFCNKNGIEGHAKYLKAYCRVNRITLYMLKNKYNKYRHGIARDTRTVLDDVLLKIG